MDEQINQNTTFLTLEEFSAIYSEKDERYELIDGIAYMMSAPSTIHQDLIIFMTLLIGNFLKGRKCKLSIAPYDVFLNENNKLKKNKRVKGTVVQPDLMVICDRDKIKPDGCHGAPDFIVEIASLSNKKNEDKDYSLKLYKYFSSGVKEYWIVNPKNKIISVYIFNSENKKSELELFTFEDKVKSHVLEGLEINFAEFSME